MSQYLAVLEVRVRSRTKGSRDSCQSHESESTFRILIRLSELSVLILSQDSASPESEFIVNSQTKDSESGFKNQETNYSSARIKSHDCVNNISHQSEKWGFEIKRIMNEESESGTKGFRVRIQEAWARIISQKHQVMIWHNHSRDSVSWAGLNNSLSEFQIHRKSWVSGHNQETYTLFIELA